MLTSVRTTIVKKFKNKFCLKNNAFNTLKL